jgi:hypothetical protein
MLLVAHARISFVWVGWYDCMIGDRTYIRVNQKLKNILIAFKLSSFDCGAILTATLIYPYC